VVEHGERRSRISFAERMLEDAFSFPRSQMVELAALVLKAARDRNGWRVIREATVIRKTGMPAKILTKPQNDLIAEGRPVPIFQVKVLKVSRLGKQKRAARG